MSRVQSERPGTLAIRVVVSLCLLGAVPCGCSSGRSGGWFQRRKTTEDWVNQALEAECPDDRREGVVGLAKSDEAGADWAFKVFDTIARTDTDAMVRCVAVRGMVDSHAAECVPTLIKLLESGGGHVAGVRAAPGPVRHEAAKALRQLVGDQAYEEPQRGEIIGTLLDRLARDGDRNVRLMLVDAMAYFQESQLLSALIDAMEEDDFAFRHAAERSLIALTGRTHHHNPVAWRAWLTSTDAPFAGAGTTPPELQQAKSKPRWEWPWEW